MNFRLNQPCSEEDGAQASSNMLTDITEKDRQKKRRNSKIDVPAPAPAPAPDRNVSDAIERLRADMMTLTKQAEERSLDHIKLPEKRSTDHVKQVSQSFQTALNQINQESAARFEEIETQPHSQQRFNEKCSTTLNHMQSQPYSLIHNTSPVPFHWLLLHGNARRSCEQFVFHVRIGRNSEHAALRHVLSCESECACREVFSMQMQSSH